MTILRRIFAFLLAIVLLAGTVLFLVGGGGGLGWILYFGIFCVGFIGLAVVIQLCLFFLMKNAKSAGFDFLYWFVFALSLGLVGYFYFVMRAAVVVMFFFGRADALMGYPLLLLLPIFIQIPLLVMREIRVRSMS